jgi:HlyD family secretion protein
VPRLVACLRRFIARAHESLSATRTIRAALHLIREIPAVNDEALPRADGVEPLTAPGSIHRPASALYAEPAVTSGRRTRLIVVGSAIAVVVLLAGVIAWRLHSAGQTKTDPADAMPLVTARVPGQSQIIATVNFTGGIVARYDMPIGVEGEGGRVSNVLVESGDHVVRGQLLAQLDPSVVNAQVANLRAAVEQARAEAVLAEADYRRASAVADSVGALSKEEVDKRRSTVATTAARVKSAEAQLAEVEARHGRTDIRAPADGIVLTRTAEAGQTAVAGGTTLFRLARGGEVEMRAVAAEQDIPRLKVGQTADVYLTGIATPFHGTVRLVSAVIDPQTRLGEIRVALPQHPDLRPGAFARGEVRVGSETRPVVPQTSVLANGPENFVYVVGADSHVTRRVVRIAGTQPQGIVISEGLDGTENIVSTAGAFLHEGEQVRLAGAKEKP